MDFTTKTSGRYLAEIKSTTASTKAPNGSFDAVLSMPTVDRDREVVDAKAFDPLPDHITIDIDHAMTVEKTIGSGRPYYDGAVLRFSGTYASHPLAQMVRSLVDEGHIRTMSVAYMNAHYEIDDADGLAHLRKGELLNAGIVGIPSNREALITASKSLATSVAEATHQPIIATGGVVPASGALVGEKGPEVVVIPAGPFIKSGARHAAADLKRIQAAHDALAELGAECTSKAHTPDAVKAAPEPTELTPETTAAPAAVKSPAPVEVAPTVSVLALAAEAALLLTQ